MNCSRQPRRTLSPALFPQLLLHVHAAAPAVGTLSHRKRCPRGDGRPNGGAPREQRSSTRARARGRAWGFPPTVQPRCTRAIPLPGSHTARRPVQIPSAAKSDDSQKWFRYEYTLQPRQDPSVPPSLGMERILASRTEPEPRRSTTTAAGAVASTGAESMAKVHPTADSVPEAATEAESAARLREELQALELSALKQRAGLVGVSALALEAAVDKSAVIELICTVTKRNKDDAEAAYVAYEPSDEVRAAVRRHQALVAETAQLSPLQPAARRRQVAALGQHAAGDIQRGTVLLPDPDLSWCSIISSVRRLLRRST